MLHTTLRLIASTASSFWECPCLLVLCRKAHETSASQNYTHLGYTREIYWGFDLGQDHTPKNLKISQCHFRLSCSKKDVSSPNMHHPNRLGILITFTKLVEDTSMRSLACWSEGPYPISTQRAHGYRGG